MTKLNKIKYIAVLCVISILCACFGFAFAPTTANANVEKQVSSVFDIESMSLRITDQGMRWIAKMDSTTYENITTKDNVSLHFVIAPTGLMDAANGDYMGMEKKIQIDIADYSKMYNDGDFWYVNGAVNNLKAENKELVYTAVAAIGTTIDGVTTYEYTSTKISNSAYGIANWAIVNGALEVEDVAKILNTYSYLGTESTPIACADETEFANLVNVDDGEIFADKVVTLPYDGEDVVLFAQNEKGYSNKTPLAAVSATASDDAVASFVDGEIVAGTTTGNTVLTAVIEKDGLNVTQQIPVTVKAIPNVVISANDITVHNRELKGDNNAVVYNYYAELTPSVSIDGATVSGAGFTYSLKENANCISIYDNNTFLSIFGEKKGVTVVEVGYTDSYGVKTTKDVNVTVDAPLYYGQHEKYPVDGVVAHLTSLAGFVMEGVDLTSKKDDALIRLQYIPTNTYTGSWSSGDNGNNTALAAPGPQLLLITIVDAEDSSNYITVGVRQSYDNWGAPQHVSRIGARVGSWGTYSANSPSASDFYANGKGGMGVGGGSAYGIFFSMYGAYLNEKDHQCASTCYYCGREYLGINYVENYERFMLSLSVVGTKVYTIDLSAGGWVELVDLANVSGKASWSGFSSSKVNIMVTATNPTSGQPDDCSIMVDTLGGQKLTDISKNMYFSRNWNDNVLGDVYKR